jgi:hypothetical protein
VLLHVRRVDLVRSVDLNLHSAETPIDVGATIPGRLPVAHSSILRHMQQYLFAQLSLHYPLLLKDMVTIIRKRDLMV